MKYAMKVVVVCATALAASATAAIAQGGDRDCSDFSSWREAQSFYDSQGPGDPHRLDADSDGIACESLR